MDCEIIRAALSARADGREAQVPGSVVSWHVRTCADCAVFASVVEGFPPPNEAGGIDLSKRVVAMAGQIDRGGVWWGLQAALFIIAVGELVLAIPDLLGHPTGAVADVHMARHLGAFQAAYAVGLIVVALRPAKARALVPLTAALAAAMVGAAIADVVQGSAPAISEAQHSLEISGLLLVWLLASRRGWPRQTRREPRLRAAQDETDATTRPRLVTVEETDGLLGRHTA